MKFLQKCVTVLISFILLGSASIHSAKALNHTKTIEIAGNQIYVNDKKINWKNNVKPVMYKKHIMAPYRAFLEAIGFKVTFDLKSKTIYGYRNQLSIRLKQGSTALFINDASKRTLKFPPTVVKNNLMVPARSIANELGYSVNISNDPSKQKWFKNMSAMKRYNPNKSVTYYVREVNLDQKGSKEVIVAFESGKQNALSQYKKVWIGNVVNNRFKELTSITAPNVPFADIDTVRMQGSLAPYLHITSYNKPHSGFSLYRYNKGLQAVVKDQWNPTSYLDDRNHDGYMDSYLTFSGGWSSCYYSIWKRYDWKGGSFVKGDDYAQLPDYPKDPKSVVGQFLTLSDISLFRKIPEIEQRLAEISDAVKPTDAAIQEFDTCTTLLSHGWTFNASTSNDLETGRKITIVHVSLREINFYVSATFTLDYRNDRWVITGIKE